MAHIPQHIFKETNKIHLFQEILRLLERLARWDGAVSGVHLMAELPRHRIMSYVDGSYPSH